MIEAVYRHKAGMVNMYVGPLLESVGGKGKGKGAGKRGKGSRGKPEVKAKGTREEREARGLAAAKRMGVLTEE